MPQPTTTSQASARQASSPQASYSLWQRLLWWSQQNSKLLLNLGGILVAGLILKNLFFQPAVITVAGTGELSVTPDKVEMLVTRVDSNPDPVVVIVNGEDSVSKLINKAKEIGGQDVEIQKSFYQVTPSVVGNDVLYQVVNVFKVTAADHTKASDLIKGLYSEGATTVSGVNFIPEAREKVTQDARKAAIKDARSQARDIARAAGKRLGRMVSVGDDLTTGSSTVSTDGAQVDGAEDQAGAQVDLNNGVPSQIDVSKTMTVTYQIW